MAFTIAALAVAGFGIIYRRIRAGNLPDVADDKFFQDYVSRTSAEISDGLLRGNPVSETALNLETFLQDLQRLSETAAHCRLVVSDERAISREGLVKLATRQGAQLDGIPPEELDRDEEYAARFDLPVEDVTILMSDDPPGITLQFIA